MTRAEWAALVALGHVAEYVVKETYYRPPGLPGSSWQPRRTGLRIRSISDEEGKMAVTGIGSAAAFPLQFSERNVPVDARGLTKRELVAAMIWAVAVGNPAADLTRRTDEETRAAARVAIHAADILLEELSK